MPDSSVLSLPRLKLIDFALIDVTQFRTLYLYCALIRTNFTPKGRQKWWNIKSFPSESFCLVPTFQVRNGSFWSEAEDKGYDILIGPGILSELGPMLEEFQPGRNFVMVTDSNVEQKVTDIMRKEDE